MKGLRPPYDIMVTPDPLVTGKHPRGLVVIQFKQEYIAMLTQANGLHETHSGALPLGPGGDDAP